LHSIHGYLFSTISPNYLEKNLDHINLLIKGKSGPKGRERLVLHYFLITLATTAQSRLTLVSTKLTEFSAASGGGGGDS
jgi:hypothetical protein